MARKTDQRGRSKNDAPHVRLYHGLMATTAWRHTSLGARCLLLEIVRRWNGGNNGEIFISVREAADLLGVHRNTAVKLFHELDDKGFTAITSVGHFKVKGGPATARRLTWIRWNNQPPTREYDRWIAPVGNKTRSQINDGMVTRIVTGVGKSPQPVTPDVTTATETSHVSSTARGCETVTLVSSHRLDETEPVSEQRKHTENGERRFPDLLDGEAIDQLRERLTTYLDTASIGAQSRLAETARIPSGTLSKFKDGRGLPAAHFVNLQLALTDAQRRDAA